jgi:predicted ATP-dependent protease
MSNTRELAAGELTHLCHPDSLGFETTDDIAPLEGTVGQERAVNAVDFGIHIQTPGFNVYVAGKPGTGRSTSVLAHVTAKAKTEPSPSDWCYVYNFDDPYRPTAIRLSPGRGPEFAQDMETFIKLARIEIPRAFESENYEKRKSGILEVVQQKREQLLVELREQASELGFAVEATPVGIASVPLTQDGRPYTREEYDDQPEERKKELRARSARLQESINQFVARSRGLEKEAQEQLQHLDREIAFFAVGHLLEDLRAKYRTCDGMGDCEAMLKYLDGVENDIVERLDDFRSSEKKQQTIPPGLEELAEPSFDRYKVNVFVTHGPDTGAPVVRENNPTYNNLVGRQEYKARWGFMSTDHNMIRPGSVHKANGGYLVLQALDVLLNPFAWDYLKRVLRTREAAPESLADQYGLISVASLKPQPIPLDLKVVMIGSPYLYYLLYYLDDDFRKLFKVKADFDLEMSRTDRHIGQYAAFVADRVKNLGLKTFHKTAVAEVVNYGSRLVEDKHRLSTRFVEIADLVSEAAYWAGEAKSEIVTRDHVLRAIEQREYRSRMIEDKVQQLIEEGTIIIDVDRAVIGQANALSVYDLGDYSFGRPSRVTARVAVGRGGVVDIQREAKLGGRVHTKGVMIITGYLQGKYGQDKPIAIHATLAFEQLYEEVEGDSASSTELYALLSTIAGIPLRQGIAVTGSINQHGLVQPIGGVNRKIEGFYEICRAKGLDGTQGVIIPAANIRHLMLKSEVVQAVRQGQFHIWAVENVDQGIEVLTGLQAGELLPEGGYPPGTIHHLVDTKLRTYASVAQRYLVPPTEGEAVGEQEPAASVRSSSRRSEPTMRNSS